MLLMYYLCRKISFIMTLNEKKQLTNYIKGLVRESFNAARPYDEFGGSAPKVLQIYKDMHPEGVIAINPEAAKGDPNRKVFIPADAIKIWKEDYVAIGQADYDEYCAAPEEEYDDNGIADDMRQDDEWGPDGSIYDDNEEMDNDKNEVAGLNELRQLAESMAREAVAGILSESKKKKGKRKNKKEKSSSKDKTVVSKLNADGTNAAHYYYKLYGVENGTEAEKAAARSKGYKKAKGKKNDTGVPYKFTSKERNRLGSLLTDR